MTHQCTARLVSRPVALVVLPTLLLLTGLTACQHADAPAHEELPLPAGEVRFDPGSPQLHSITVERVRARTQRVVALLPAQLVMDENHTVRVFPSIGGRVRTLDAQPGDYVTRGQALAHIVSGDAAQAASDVTRAAAAAAQTSAAYARMRDLYEHHVVAQKDLEQAESDNVQAQAELARARARGALLGTMDPVTGEFVLRAPIAGMIIDRSANPGAEVRPDAASPLFTISDIGTLWLVANVYQQDLANVHIGERLEFTTDAAPGATFTGTVTYVGGTLDSQTRTAAVRATLPNRDHRLLPETFGAARLLAPERGSASGQLPVVPTTALVTHGNETVVFVQIGPGQFQRRPVAVGDDDGTTATITDGLRVGDRVVTRGSILLGDAAGE